MWRSLSEGPVDNVMERVSRMASEEDVVLHVGTDSQQSGGHTDFVTVIAVITPAAGGRVFYRKERIEGRQSLAERLFREAELSITVAQTLDGLVLQDLIVHVDANVDPRHRSSKFVAGLAGMVRGYGFQVQLKPDSWCATHVADHLVKDRHRRAA